MRTADRVPRVTVGRGWIVALLLAGCDGAGPVGPGRPDPPTFPKPPGTPAEALHLDAQGDTNLTGMVGTNVAVVPVVRLTTADGDPVPGRDVYFWAGGGGAVQVSTQRTDTAGLASPGRWTLGTSPRLQTLRAWAAGADDVVFAVDAKAGPVAFVRVVAGNNQAGAAGAALPLPLQVEVADPYGNPIPDELVGFTVRLGAGTILGESTRTDSAGVASSGSWTLTGAGAHVVRAAAGGKVVDFGAFACGDPCVGRDLYYRQGETLFRLVNGVASPVLDVGNDYIEVAPSPVGQRLAVARWHFGVFEIESMELFLMDADGSNSSLHAASFYSPSWSPDGRQLAVGGPFEGPIVGVHAMSAEPDGSPPVLLAAGGSGAAWSPDGTSIAFLDYNDQMAIKLVHPDGSAGPTLRRGYASGIGNPVWSPDGRRVAFLECEEFVGCDIVIASADGSSVTSIAKVDESAWGLQWSPDGSRFAFHASGGTYWIPADRPEISPILGLQEGFLTWIP